MLSGQFLELKNSIKTGPEELSLDVKAGSSYGSARTITCTLTGYWVNGIYMPETITFGSYTADLYIWFPADISIMTTSAAARVIGLSTTCQSVSDMTSTSWKTTIMSNTLMYKVSKDGDNGVKMARYTPFGGSSSTGAYTGVPYMVNYQPTQSDLVEACCMNLANDRTTSWINCPAVVESEGVLSEGSNVRIDFIQQRVVPALPESGSWASTFSFTQYLAVSPPSNASYILVGKTRNYHINLLDLCNSIVLADGTEIIRNKLLITQYNNVLRLEAVHCSQVSKWGLTTGITDGYIIRFVTSDGSLFVGSSGEKAILI